MAIILATIRLEPTIGKLSIANEIDIKANSSLICYNSIPSQDYVWLYLEIEFLLGIYKNHIWKKMFPNMIFLLTFISRIMIIDCEKIMHFYIPL